MSFTCKQLLIHSKEKKLVDIDFTFEKSFALIGESGSGKSLTLKALLGMLPKNLDVTIDLDNIDFVLERGKNVALVPQNPFTALSPLTKIIDQFLVPKDEACKYFEMVGLETSFLDRFPSELSGGQLQRVVIAFALHANPKLLLLDEPTTALDVKSKESILKLLQELHVKSDFKLMFVTHDIEAVRELCEDIAIIKEGKIVEAGNLKTIIENPQNEYTKQLINAGFKNRGFRI
ncbi:ATP-binding cassette domain-containing protein [Sulfurospirillum arcachonense]|uniref:ATP-binding cassette domain-containing protein n=1 Tax=Sulfurospirillum arcachonense TaxID=57666 RepID=UPI000468F4BC|nr:ATP-binding cassette domain-containing protein [Sulfurospirillum arcachonense]